jgi:methionyl-tRNA formyltransferase
VPEADQDKCAIVFFGSGAFGVPTLRHLAARHRVVGIVTQPDKPAGRGGQMTPTPIALCAAEVLPWVPILKPESCNEPGIAEQIRAWPHEAGRDAWVVIAFGQYLGKKLLRDRFAINLHASLLPRWRGAAPIHAAILEEETRTGNSVITLAERMDAGLVLGQSQREIEPTQTTGELHDLLAAGGPLLVEDVLGRHAAGTLSPLVQDEAAVTIAGKLSKRDGVVDWSQPAAWCRCRINGLSPWPGVMVVLAGTTLKLLRAGPSEMLATTQAGTVMDPQQGLLSCGDGRCIALLEVQPAGKRAMSWDAFVRGHPIAIGTPLLAPPPPSMPLSRTP